MFGNTLGALRRTAFSACAVLLAAFISLFAFASSADAAQGVTRTIGGVNYTLPSDWAEVEIPVDVQQDIQVADAVAFTKNDAVFFALHIATSPGEYVSFDEFEEVAQQVVSELAGTPFDSVVASAQIEQGYPALTLYTNDIAFNDIVYALTFKLFAVDNSSTSDAVIMCSFLPADGVLHEDVFAGMPYYDEPQPFQLADVAYELPGGSSMAWGHVFDFEYMVAIGQDGVLLGFEIPMLADDGTVVAADLNEAAAQLQFELENQLASQGLGDLIRNLWVGGYDFVGFPTLGLEFMLDAGGEASVYVCSTVNITPDGSAFIALAQPSNGEFAAYVLGSASPAADEPSGGLISGFSGESSADTPDDRLPVDPGFVIAAVG